MTSTINQVFVNIKDGGLRNVIKPVKNIDFELFDKTKPETTYFRGKPIEGGLWTTDDGYTWTSHIINNLKVVPTFEDKLPKNGKYWEFYNLTAKEPNLYIVDSKEDYNYLLDKYLLEKYLTFNYLNWEGISKDYDGVKLTMKGQEETKRDLFGWEVPQILWFKWVFEEPGTPQQVPFTINLV
ncbi:hypothetical protein [Bacillus sp. AFS041924]|uniref:hypothetical protein n=1 Tax=Bacillus sp. AFS041924 TaxID=2033503 RepID=UPI000BFC7EA4|nr:hypothetical protein [Bacillus sp. AFS041924]PGS49896.1 hypothetical protein COC46_14195 [Bacillus sp. AFS041924]